MGLLDDLLEIQAEMRAKYPLGTMPKALIFVNANDKLWELYQSFIPAVERAVSIRENRPTMIAGLPVYESTAGGNCPTDGVWVEFMDGHFEKVMEA